MVASRPDVIVAITTPAVAALRQETRDIPLIFANMSDPVDGGYVQSMARPGGNITGFTSFEYSIGGKWVELLKEAVASLRRVLVLYNPDNYTSRALLSSRRRSPYVRRATMPARGSRPRRRRASRWRTMNSSAPSPSSIIPSIRVRNCALTFRAGSI